MAGLGTTVKSNYAVRSRMGGQHVIGGQSTGVWYFDKDGNDFGFMGDRRYPSAHFEIIEGQPTTLSFENLSPMDHTIHLHGLDVDQLNDGVPQTSFSVPMFGTNDYEFIAPHAGTYHYHCHVDTVVHYHRGMSGAIIVRPPDGSITRAWDGGPSFDEEVLWQLMTFDRSWTSGVSGSSTARHRPSVFMINGHDTTPASLDPYSRLVASVGQKLYLRLLNSSYQWGRIRLAGYPFEVVASDGRPMNQVVTTDSWDIGPGERYDLLISPTAPISADATVEYLDDYTGGILGTVATRLEIA